MVAARIELLEQRAGAINRTRPNSCGAFEWRLVARLLGIAGKRRARPRQLRAEFPKGPRGPFDFGDC